MSDNREHAKLVTHRFIQEMDRIVGITPGKIPQYKFSEIVGISPGNLTRLRTSPNNYVTLDACCRLCIHYGTDPAVLLLGEDHEQHVDQRIEKLDNMISQLDKTLSKLTKKTLAK